MAKGKSSKRSDPPVNPGRIAAQKVRQLKKIKEKQAAAAKQEPVKAPIKPKHAPPAPSKPTVDSTAASPVVVALVERMKEKGLQWHEAVKPLKDTAAEQQQQQQQQQKTKGKQHNKAAPSVATQLSEAEIQTKKMYAQRLLEAEVARFDGKKQAKLSSDDKYLATMMSKGTLADRVAALTLTIQSSPFHTLTRLMQLISMANKKARRESIMAVESLKDLFINNLLPDDRKLNYFHQNPLHLDTVTDQHVTMWFFEHCLKTAFAQLVGVLANGMNDAVDNHKRACIRAANALLSAKPEQEAVLLSMLVNKLGDPDRKIASYIHKTLQELLREHPLMKRVVVDEVERLLTRTKVSDRTKYNAVLFLNQILLRKDDDDDAALAGHLIRVYFALFTKEVHGFQVAQEALDKKRAHKAAKKKAKGTKGAAATEAASRSNAALDRKLLSALLAGVNRAFPYAKSSTMGDLQNEIDTLFKVVHVAHHFHTGVQALQLLFQVMHATHSVSDRFFTALYEKLMDPRLRETSKHTLFLNLVFKAMKADVSVPRASAMTKRLLQLTSVMSPAFTCAVLFLLSEVVKIKPHLRALLDQPEGGEEENDDGMVVVAKKEEEEEDNVVYTAEDADKEEDEDREEDKDEDEEELPEGLRDGLTDAERTAKVLADMFGSTEDKQPSKPRKVTSFEKDDETTTSTKPTSSSYDWQKRNPLYANAETSCAWELHHLLTHYHPSVQMFARQLVLNVKQGIQYAGDPLVDFTMHAFFEKFMNKKPRHKGVVVHRDEDEDEDEDEAALARGGADKRAQRTSAWTFAAINSEMLLEQSQDAVDVSDQFFYKFFKERAERDAAHPSSKRQRKKKKSEHDDDRDGDVFSDGEDDDDGEDEELEAYAQQLAEGIMQDGDLDDEDPDMDDWSGPEDDDDEDDDDGGEGEEDAVDDEEGMAFDDDEDDEEDDDGGMLDGEEDDEEEEDEDDDESDDDGFDFGAMGGDDDDDDDDGAMDEDEEDEMPKKKGKVDKKAAAKRKPLFADADDYEKILQEAMAAQQAKKNKRKGGPDHSSRSSSSKNKKARRV